MEDVESSFSTVSKNVEAIMIKYPDTRDSDKLLWIAYLAFHCNLKQINQSPNAYQFFKDLIMNEDTPQMATVIRCRAKIQENGYLAGEKWIERRAIAERVRNIMINTDA